MWGITQIPYLAVAYKYTQKMKHHNEAEFYLEKTKFPRIENANIWFDI
jgi:hypothetical protein